MNSETFRLWERQKNRPAAPTEPVLLQWVQWCYSKPYTSLPLGETGTGITEKLHISLVIHHIHVLCTLNVTLA